MNVLVGINKNVFRYNDLDLYEEGLRNIGYEFASYFPSSKILINVEKPSYGASKVIAALNSGIQERGNLAEVVLNFPLNKVNSLIEKASLPLIFLGNDEKLFKNCLGFFNSCGEPLDENIRRFLELSYDSAWTHFRGSTQV